MLASTNSWTPYIVASALTISLFSIYILKKRKKNYQKVGKVTKLFFFPVKSLKGVEVTKGKCTEYGFEVNGLLDRSFMLINKDSTLISQRQAPSLVLLTPHIHENYLIISGPNTDVLKVKIKKSPSSNDKKIQCRVHEDSVEGIDCGDEAAEWFQSYLKMEYVHLVQFFPEQMVRKYTKTNPFFAKLRKNHVAGFQDLSAIHLMSQASIDDLNSRLGETKISVLNFRPNILVDGCTPYAEDSWKYVCFNSKAELLRLILTTRCLLTTNDPDTGILTQKEPLITLRKYRIVAEEKLFKIYGSVPILGVSSAVLKPGEIEVGDEIFAVVEQMPKMKEQKE